MTGGFPAALPIASILFPFALASRDVQPVQVAATIEVNRKRQSGDARAGLQAWADT
jgi:hypothetical protein